MSLSSAIVLIPVRILFVTCRIDRTSWIWLASSSLRSFKHLRPLSRWLYLAMAAVVSYTPPWWVNLLHRLPHFNLQFEQTSSDFRPEDWTYQQVNKGSVINSVWQRVRSSSHNFSQWIGEITSMCPACRAVFRISPLIAFSTSWWRLILLHLFPLLYLLIRVAICARLAGGSVSRPLTQNTTSWHHEQICSRGGIWRKLYVGQLICNSCQQQSICCVSSVFCFCIRVCRLWFSPIVWQENGKQYTEFWVT